MQKLKGLTFLLLLLLLVLCSGVHQCDARSGKHWSWRRSSRAPSTSALRRKGKAKSSSSGSHKQNGKGSQSPHQPSPTAPASPPSGEPVQGNGSQAPAMPAPSGGSGYQLPPPPPLRSSPSTPSPPAAPSSQDTVFNVVEFGAKGDGVTDDTQVTITAFKMLCFQLGSRHASVACIIYSELDFFPPGILVYSVSFFTASIVSSNDYIF